MDQRADHTLSVAFDRAPLPMAVIGADFGYRRVNDAMVRVMGGDRAEVLREQPGRTTHPDDLPTVVAALERIRHGSPLERFRVRTTAPARAYDVTVVRVEGDPDVVGVAYLVDTTEVDLATRDLEHQLQRDRSGALAAHAIRSTVASLLRSAEDDPEAEVVVVTMGFAGLSDLREHLDVGGFDDLLLDATRRLQRTDPALVVGHLDADRFVLLGRPLRGADATGEVVERVRRALREHRPASPLHRLQPHFGVAVSRPGDDASDLLDHAADALAQAFDRAEPVVFADRSSPGARKLARSVSRRLPAAIEHDEITTRFQPIIDLRTDEIVAAEALARWDAAPAAVGPVTFIRIAEQIGLMPALGDHLLARAVAEWVDLLDRVARPLDLHVNVSPHQLDARVADRMLGIVDEAGLDPHRLVLELTERADIDVLDAAGPSVRVLTDAGVRFALDDFGTGHSWFERLARVEPAIVKLDEQFTQQISTREGMLLAAAVVSAARAVDAVVVAEGLTQIGQAAAFRHLGCDQGQGYFFGTAATTDALAATLGSTRAASRR